MLFAPLDPGHWAQGVREQTAVAYAAMLKQESLRHGPLVRLPKAVAHPRSPFLSLTVIRFATDNH